MSQPAAHASLAARFPRRPAAAAFPCAHTGCGAERYCTSRDDDDDDEDDEETGATERRRKSARFRRCSADDTGRVRRGDGDGDGKDPADEEEDEAE